MHITFLIGNGFDRNLGLNTAYSDFVKEYKQLKSDSGEIELFRNHIKENEQLWSAAEEALGQYTSYLEEGEGLAFSECQSDFCTHLSEYLKRQEQRISYDTHSEQIKKAFAQFKNLSSPFSADERSNIDHSFSAHQSENIIYDFINYNYTYTLDKCLKIVRSSPELLGTHSYNGRKFKHEIGKVCHVHGTVDEQMVFGVNDESQIANPKIFNGNDGDLSKSLLIKLSTNISYGENTDAVASGILDASSIVYIYGMSLGVTDKLWWGRICKWLKKNEYRHLIIHQYNMPQPTVFPFDRLRFSSRQKESFLKLGNFPETDWGTVKDRIHITDHNIFEPIRNLVDAPDSFSLADHVQAAQNAQTYFNNGGLEEVKKFLLIK